MTFSCPKALLRHRDTGGKFERMQQTFMLQTQSQTQNVFKAANKIISFAKRQKPDIPP